MTAVKPTSAEMPAVLSKELLSWLAELRDEKTTGEHYLRFKTTCGGVNPNSVVRQTETKVFAE